MTLSTHTEQVRHYAAIKRRLWAAPTKAVERPVKPVPPIEASPVPIVARQVYAKPIGPGMGMVFSKPKLTAVSRRILAETAALYGVSVLDLRSKRRDYRTCRARDCCGWRMKHETTLSLTSIGRLLGARDHSTTLKSVRRHQARIDAGEVMP
jgi:hypothetical protein